MKTNINFNKNTKLFYDFQNARKVLINGYNLLNNAMLRQTKGEYYILVKYQEGETLPKEYVPIDDEILEYFGFDKQERFATVNPEIYFTTLINDSRIKRITRLDGLDDKNVQYLIGKGPEVISTLDLIYEQLEKYKEANKLR